MTEWNSEPSGGGISDLSSFDTDDLAEGATNLYYSEALVSANTDVAANTAARHAALTVTDSGEIDFTLTGQDLTAALKTGSIDVLKLDSGVQTSLGLADSSLQSSDIGDSVQAHSSILDNTTASFTTAQETKLGFISVTQAVDLDQMELDIAALDAAITLQGTWDASTGTLPGGGTAQAGYSYIVSVGGTVDGEVFTANDRIVAITDNASTTTYAANWHKLDYTDQVLSVFGRTGAVTAQTNDYTWAQINKATSSLADITTRSHTDLQNQAWTSSGHTGTASRLAAFSGAGAASEIDYSTDWLTQYALLAGRSTTTNNLIISTSASGAQIALSSAPGGGGSIVSTTHATKGSIAMGSLSDGVIWDAANAQFNVGTSTAALSAKMTVEMGTSNFTAQGDRFDLFGIVFLNRDQSASTRSLFSFKFADTSANIVDGSRFLGGKEQEWTSTVSTRKAYIGFQTRDGANLLERLRLDSQGNLRMGADTIPSAGTSARGVLAIGNGTEPSTSPADTLQIYAVDLSAGNSTLGIRTETAVVSESVTSDRTLSVRINGTTYKILLKA